MDTTYASIMLVVFLVLAALAIDIGYMYVSDEDLNHAAELSALAGAQGIKQVIHARIQSDPKKLETVVNDTVQSPARVAAIESAMGAQRAVALIEVPSNNTNTMTTENNLTVGFWNAATATYTPGGTPVNAMQVRTKRTAESESVGLGQMGTIIAKITGIETVNYNPVSIAAIPAKARANIAISTSVCDRGCTYPEICQIPERKMSRGGGDPAGSSSPDRQYAYTSLLYPVTDASILSEMICREMPPQDVCGRNVYTSIGTGDDPLRDMESMMYNPKIDSSNKEYDKASGKLIGWWVIAPVVDALPVKAGGIFEERAVSRYALVRISRICADGGSGCAQTGKSFDAPASQCAQGNGLFIDRISCVGCGTKEMLQMPGLHPVLVK